MRLVLFSKLAAELAAECCVPLPAAGQVPALLVEALPRHVFVALLALLFPALLDAPILLSLCESVLQLPFVLPAAHEVSGDSTTTAVHISRPVPWSPFLLWKDCRSILPNNCRHCKMDIGLLFVKKAF